MVPHLKAVTVYRDKHPYKVLTGTEISTQFKSSYLCMDITPFKSTYCILIYSLLSLLCRHRHTHTHTHTHTTSFFSHSHPNSSLSHMKAQAYTHTHTHIRPLVVYMSFRCRRTDFKASTLALARLSTSSRRVPCQALDL